LPEFEPPLPELDPPLPEELPPVPEPLLPPLPSVDDPLEAQEGATSERVSNKVWDTRVNRRLVKGMRVLLRGQSRGPVGLVTVTRNTLSLFSPSRRGNNGN